MPVEVLVNETVDGAHEGTGRFTVKLAVGCANAAKEKVNSGIAAKKNVW